MIGSTCRRLRPALVDLALGTLPRGDVPHIEAHVAACPECRADLELLGHDLALRPEAAAAPEPARGPADPASRARIIRMAPRRVIWREWVLGGYAAAATAVCAFLMFANTAIFGPVAPLVPRLATSK